MAITANTLPSVYPDYALPVDSSLQFASAQTLTASGYVNNGTAQIQVNPGRLTGMLACDITAVATGSSNEYYQLLLLGSNDSTWTSGNVCLLTAFDIPSAASVALLETICGAYPTIPPAGKGGWLRAQPFTNYIGGGYVFQYMKLYCIMGGTSPSITLSAWLVPLEMRV